MSNRILLSLLACLVMLVFGASVASAAPWNPNDPSYQLGYSWNIRNTGPVANPYSQYPDDGFYVPLLLHRVVPESRITDYGNPFDTAKRIAGADLGLAGVRERAIPLTGRGTRICVADSGYNQSADLPPPIAAMNVSGEGDPSVYRENEEHVTQYTTHGTQVAAIVVAKEGNGIGSVGIAPDAGLIVAQTTTAGGTTWGGESEARRAIQFCLANGADVVNLSTDFAVGLDANALMRSNPQVLFVFAAGNSAVKSPFDPATTTRNSTTNQPLNVVRVTTTSQDDTLARYSTTDSSVELAAPADWIPATSGSTGTDPNAIAPVQLFLGTSAAAPTAAGVALLVKQVAPYASGSQIREALMLSSRPVAALRVPGAWQVRSGGVINAAGAAALVDADQAAPLTITQHLGASYSTGTGTIPYGSNTFPTISVTPVRASWNPPTDHVTLDETTSIQACTGPITPTPDPSLCRAYTGDSLSNHVGEFFVVSSSVNSLTHEVSDPPVVLPRIVRQGMLYAPVGSAQTPRVGDTLTAGTRLSDFRVYSSTMPPRVQYGWQINNSGSWDWVDAPLTSTSTATGTDAGLIPIGPALPSMRVDSSMAGKQLRFVVTLLADDTDPKPSFYYWPTVAALSPPVIRLAPSISCPQLVTPTICSVSQGVWTSAARGSITRQVVTQYSTDGLLWTTIPTPASLTVAGSYRVVETATSIEGSRSAVSNVVTITEPSPTPSPAPVPAPIVDPTPSPTPAPQPVAPAIDAAVRPSIGRSAVIRITTTPRAVIRVTYGKTTKTVKANKRGLVIVKVPRKQTVLFALKASPSIKRTVRT